MSVQVASHPVQLKESFVGKAVDCVPESKCSAALRNLEQYRIKNVPSDLFYIRNLITEEEERQTVEGICSEPESEWIRHKEKRQHKQEWGTIKHADGRVEMIGKPLPKWSDAAIDRIIDLGIDFSETDNGRPMFLRVNEYPIGYGIHPHLDVDVPGRSNAIVTMKGTALLDFYEPEGEGDDSTLEERHICSILMEPRSLLIVSGEMFNKLHGIKEVKKDLITEKVVNRGDIPVGSVVKRAVRYSMACTRETRKTRP